MKLTDLNVIEDTINDLSFLEEPESNVDFSTPNIVPVEQYKAQFEAKQQETLSFHQHIEEEKTKQQTEDTNDPQTIIRKITIDKFNAKCIRIEITPSVCTICGFDVAAKRHGRWGLVPVSERKTVVEALAEHKKVAHTLGDLLIIKKSQVPRQWLGSGNHL